MSDVKVTLGDVTFKGMEIPSKIPFGGEQDLVVQKLVGGSRVIDALGAFENDIEWSGIFFGSDAIWRAKYLDVLRMKGKELRLTWSSLDYQIVIKSFVADYEYETRIPYKITCVVIKNNTIRIVRAATRDHDYIVNEFLDSAVMYATSATEQNMAEFDAEVAVNLADIKTKMIRVQSSIRNLNGLIRATVDQINNIRNQITDVQNQVTRQIASVNNFLGTITTLGGVLPKNNKASVMAAKLGSVVAHTNTSFQLLNLKFTLMNMNKEIKKVNPVTGLQTQKTTNKMFNLPTTQEVQHANLYQLASMYYGDAMKWTLIAKENGLIDPYVTTPMTLKIPVDSTGNNGVL